MFCDIKQIMFMEKHVIAGLGLDYAIVHALESYTYKNVNHLVLCFTFNLYIFLNFPGF